MSTGENQPATMQQTPPNALGEGNFWSGCTGVPSRTASHAELPRTDERAPEVFSP